MYSFTIPMALMDFIPVALFGIALWLLLADLHNKLGKGSYALFSAGGIYVFAAGFLKAVWKLLYAAGIINWIEQGINCIGQGLLLWGILVLHRAGLKDLTL